jgi:hypothetical protein
MFNFLELHNKMVTNSITLTFKGAVTFELIDSIVMIVSQRLDKIENDLNTRKKVYGTTIECLQNLCHHIDVVEPKSPIEGYDTSTAIFMIDTSVDGYQIATGNYILNQKVNHLKSFLEELINVPKEDLKQVYNRILKNKTYTEKGGGGLGLVDIAKRSSQKMEFKFEKVDENFSFFSFQINIQKDTELAA